MTDDLMRLVGPNGGVGIVWNCDERSGKDDNQCMIRCSTAVNGSRVRFDPNKRPFDRVATNAIGS